MSDIWMSNVTRVNESCDTCEWVMSHARSIDQSCLWTSPVTHKTWHTWHVWHEYIWYGLFTHVLLVRETWLIHTRRDMTHSYARHDSLICVTWLVHMWDMTRSYVWHDSFICVTWLIHVCDMTHSYMWHDSFKCVTWLIHMCDMTHSYARHDSFICVTWLIHICDMAHSYVWHDSFTRVTWLIHIRGMTHSYVAENIYINECQTTVLLHIFNNVRHDSFIFVTWLSHSCHRTYSYTWHDSFIRTGWRRCIGCLKLQVSFQKRVSTYRALLREMTYEDMASFVSSLLFTTCFTY